MTSCIRGIPTPAIDPADEKNFVAEVDNNNQGLLRFGDDEYGRSVSGALAFHAVYRIGNGLRDLGYKNTAASPSAQTERRDEAGPVRSLLGSKDLTGRLCSGAVTFLGRRCSTGQNWPKRRLNCPLSRPSTLPSPLKSKYDR